ncbi:MAG: VCBS repeat-containing protein [Planctomycetes bacterium]|nr:VCBS repeat-containing protein [Planctomycetota bacterium]MCB9919584.1 VCBS repeat-containing protein [Planctomycetota bacterium]
MRTSTLVISVLCSVVGVGCTGANGPNAVLQMAAPPAFEARQLVATGLDGVTCVAAADFTGDGKVDLAVASSVPSELRILTASSPGVFSVETAQRFALVGKPIELAALDADGDGDLDLVCRFESTVQTYANDGTGRLSPLQTFAIPATTNGLRPADIDRDGDVDLVIAAGPRIEIHTSTAGTFALTTHFELDASVRLASLWVGILDADVYPELVATDTTRNELFVWRGSAAGYEASQRLLLSLPGIEPSGVHGGDATGDGVPDLLVALTGSRRIAVFAGNGLGNFAPATTIEVRGAPDRVMLAMQSKTGRAQLVVGFHDRDAVSTIDALLGGGFGSERQFGTSGHPNHVLVTDVDGDGHAEVLTTSGERGAVCVLRGTEAGLAAAEDFVLDDASIADHVVADFDGDGDTDVVASDPRSGSCHVLVGRRDVPTERLSRTKVFDGFAEPSRLVIADMDRDGRSDVLVTTTDGLRVLLNRSQDGAIDFVVWPAMHLPAIAVATSADYRVAVGHFDGDDVGDLVVSDRDAGQCTVLFGTEDAPGFRSERLTLAAPGGPAGVVAGDLDGDGDDDIAVALADRGALRVFAGGRNGSFGSPVEFETAIGMGDVHARALDAGDRLHLVVSGQMQSSVCVVNSRDQAFGVQTIRLDGPVTAVVLLDVNVDRYADLVTADANTGELVVMLGDGRGGFVFAPRIPGVSNITSVARGDFDGDGRLDLLLSSRGADRVTLLRSLR